MKLIIDISEMNYTEILKDDSTGSPFEDEMSDLIKNGIPLPKGHGRLIDADALLEYGSCPNSCGETATCMEDYEHLHCPIRIFDIESINDTPTIIEADKES